MISWLRSYWVTYVSMSRRERQEIIRLLAEIKADPQEHLAELHWHHEYRACSACGGRYANPSDARFCIR